MTSTVTHIIAGLGNPGDKYTFTRHNAGFLCMDYISQRLGIKVNKLRFKALTAPAKIALPDGVMCHCLLMMPQTFMNSSGEAVREAAQFYKIPPENIVVMYDDSYIEVGKLRIRRGGSDGGHNGMKSIIQHLGSDRFPRVRIGVGEKPHPEMDIADHVLGKFAESEKKPVFATFERVYDALPLILSGGIELAMGKYNG